MFTLTVYRHQNRVLFHEATVREAAGLAVGITDNGDGYVESITDESGAVIWCPNPEDWEASDRQLMVLAGMDPDADSIEVPGPAPLYLVGDRDGKALA